MVFHKHVEHASSEGASGSTALQDQGDIIYDKLIFHYLVMVYFRAANLKGFRQKSNYFCPLFCVSEEKRLHRIVHTDGLRVLNVKNVMDMSDRRIVAIDIDELVWNIGLFQVCIQIQRFL